MKFKKILSVVLAAAIVSSAFSVTASAETQEITETIDKYQASGDSFVEGDFKYTELDDGTLLVRCNNKDITKAVIPSSVKGKKVTIINSYAFSYCKNLQSVTIPNSVTSIGNSAFYYCTNLQSVTIPNSVTSIGNSAFGGCESLTAINVNTNNKNYTSINGVLFNKAKTKLIQYPAGKKDKSYSIPNTVKSIGEYAFECCYNLQSITIPNSVKSIGDCAFGWSKSLTAINVDTNNKNYSSINGVLFNKAKTQLIQYPAGKKDKSYSIANSVTSIGEDAFKGCESLQSVTIPNSVKSIGDRAFEWCVNLKSVTIPNSVTSIGNSAFDYCTNLQSVTIPNSVTSIGNYAFDGCTSLQSVTIPNSVTSIGGSAFSGCSSLQSVTIPNSVKSIVDYAFYGCTSLQSVTIPNSVTSIGNSAFSGCSSLQSVTIPNSVTSIGNYAFDGCTSLQSVTIPNSVKSIVDYAFYGCTSLQSVTIPNSVTSIGEDAFRYCESIKDVYYTGTKEQWNAISIGNYNDSLINATIHYNFNPKITNLKASASNNSVKLTWDNNAAAAYYNLFVYQNSKWNRLTKVTTNSYRAIGLAANTSYKFRVSAYDKNDQYVTSSDTTVKTLANIANLKGSTSSTNSAKLTWSKPTSASYYKVFVYQNNKWNQLAKISTNSYTATKLAANTSYKFRVSAYNSSNKLLAYSDTTVKTLANVANLKASSTSNSAKLTWSKPTSANYYKVFVYQNNKWNQLAKVTTNSYTATSLNPSTSYKYRVSAYNSSNKLLAYSDVTAKTTAGKIANLNGTTTSNSAKLTWSKPTSASYYKVFVYQNNKWNQLAKVTTNSYTVTSLNPSTSYKYRVSAYNSSNKLLAYSDVTVKTK